MRKMARTLAWAGRGDRWAVPSEEALSDARARLGSAPLRLLFEKAAGPLAGPGGPGAFWRLRLVSLDGATLDVPDAAPTGRTSAARPRSRGMKLRGVRRCGCWRLRRVRHPGADHRLLRCLRHRGEDPGPAAPAPAGRQEILCLADADFACYELSQDAAAAGAELLSRQRPAQPAGGCGAGRRDVPVAAEGPRRLRKQGAADITVRVIESTSPAPPARSPRRSPSSPP